MKQILQCPKSLGSKFQNAFNTRNLLPVGLAMIMVVTGAAGLLYEYILSTVFSYLLGGTIEQFSVTIALMMGMMWLGGRLQKGYRGPLVETFIIAELLLVVTGGFSPIFLQWAYASVPIDFVWIKLAYIGLVGLLIGVEIPLIMRINEQRYSANLSDNIAATWAWDYAGAAFGLAAWLVLLFYMVPITHISFWVAGSNLAVAVFSMWFFWRNDFLRRQLSRLVTAGIFLAVLISLIVGATQVDAWSKIVTQKLYEDPIVFQTTTKYQNIVMTRGPHPRSLTDNNWELYINGNKQFSSVDEAVYHEYIVHPAMNLSAYHRRVLILGGGDGLALREVLKYKDVEEVTLVDLDPGMIEFARTNQTMQRLNQNAFADARVSSNLRNPQLGRGVTDTGKQRPVLVQTNQTEVVCKEALKEGHTKSDCQTTPVTEKVATVNIYTVDADRFVAERSDLWDVVIVDLPDPNSVELAKLYSQEFYAKVKRVLSPDGIVVTQATSPYHAKESFLCILRTMAAAGLNVLPYHDNVPSFGDWGWIFGSTNLQQDVLYDRATHLSPFPVTTRSIQSGHMNRAVVFNLGELTTTNQSISTLMNPTIFSYYQDEAWRSE